MSDTELLASRVLAHQLFTQCRRSTGPFKTLTPSIRNLRNLLEEIEDSIDDSATSGLQSRVADQVARCHAILTQVRLELQESEPASGSNETVRPRDDRLSDLRTALDVACHQLSVAHQTLDSTVQLRLDTDAMPPIRSLSSKSASLSATSDRKLSTSSSAWSLVNPDGSANGTDITAHTTSTMAKSRLSDEKQACSPTSSSSAAPRTASAWASTFALDPMSIPMEEAAAYILGEDNDAETLKMGSSVLERQSSTAPSMVLPYPVTPTDEKPAQQFEPFPPEAQLDPSPAICAADILVPPQCASPSPSKEATSPYPEEQRTTPLLLDRETEHPAQPVQVAQMQVTPERATVPSPNIDLSLRRLSSPEVPAKPEKLKRSSPALPMRAPPPPPKPRRSRPRAPSNSRYIIVNPETHDTEASEDSDDELYSTSRPSSPPKALAAQGQTPPKSAGIPEVHINGAPETVSVASSALSDTVPSPPPSRSAHRALLFNIPPARYSAFIPGIEALDDTAPAVETEIKPPQLPKRPVRYHSMRSAPAVLAPLDPPEVTTNNGVSTPDSKHCGLRERKSLLDLDSVKEGLTGRWSWQRRSRSRSELDQTQMPAAPQHRRSHSGLATLIRAEMQSTEKSKSPSQSQPPHQMLRLEDGPPPIPPRPRRSLQIVR